MICGVFVLWTLRQQLGDTRRQLGMQGVLQHVEMYPLARNPCLVGQGVLAKPS